MERGVRSMRELPKVKIGKKEYYIDKRLSQIREVNNPHNFEDVSPKIIDRLIIDKDKEPDPKICCFCNNSTDLKEEKCSKNHKWFLCSNHQDRIGCPFCAENYYRNE